ncbi:MAG: tetratricopeptide repeat protein [Candidatus Riflebacteria bacterium]|nr:tetratricopeptide repeat protein [Candidatus Riflebacteria bacterium]
MRTGFGVILLAVLLTTAAGAADLLQEGITLGKQKRYVEAEKVFLRLLQDDPMNDKGRYYLAIAYWKTGRPAQAAGELALLRDLNDSLAQNLAKVCPGIEAVSGGEKTGGTPPAVLDPGARRPGATPSSRGPRGTVRADPPPSPDSTVSSSRLTGLELARTLQQAGRVEEAAAQFRLEVRKAPVDGRDEVRLELGQCLEDAGKNSEAIKVYEEVLGPDRRPEALWRMGRLYRAEGQRQQAIATFRQLETDTTGYAEQARAAIQDLQSEMYSRSPMDGPPEPVSPGLEDDPEKKRQSLWDETNADDPRTRENAYSQLLDLDPADRLALEGMKDLMKEEGKFWRMRQYLYQMVKHGHISQSEADAEINDYEGTKK